MVEFPTNTFYGHNDKLDLKFRYLFSDTMLKLYDEWVQENDFITTTLCTELAEKGWYTWNYSTHFTKKLLEHEIWKRDGKLVCVCGFRSDKSSVIGRHRKQCPEHQRLEKHLDDTYFNDEYMHKAFDVDGLLVIDLVRHIMEKEKLDPSYKNYVYNRAFKCARDCSERGIINWSKDANHVKKAYGSRASETIRKRYGVDNISQLDEIKEKKKATCRKNFGVDHPFQHQEIQAKVKKTVQKKYGVDNVSKANEVKAKKAQTTYKHYGVDNIFKDKKRIQNSWKDKLGVDNPTKHPLIKAKALLRSTYDKDILIGHGEESIKWMLEQRLNKYYKNYTIDWNEFLFINVTNNVVYLPDFVIRLKGVHTPIVVEFQDTAHINPTLNFRKTSIPRMVKDMKRYMLFEKSHIPLILIWINSIYKDMNLFEQVISSYMSYDTYWHDHILNIYPDVVIEQARNDINETNCVLYETSLYRGRNETDKVIEEIKNAKQLVCSICGRLIMTSNPSTDTMVWICDDCLDSLMKCA